MTARLGIQACSWVLTLAVGANFGTVRAQTDSGEKIYQRALRATVWIVAPHGDPNPNGSRTVATGTGSLIDLTHRLIITNYHVVGDSNRVLALFPAFPNGKLRVEADYYRQQIKEGAGIHGEVIARDPGRDLALVRLERVPQGVHALRLATEGVSPGQRVHSIGNPGRSGALWVYTSGTVRTPAYHKRWSVKEGEKNLNFDAYVIETQSATNQGDSGGPLVNDQGDLVGVTHGYATNAQLLSLFIDAGEVRTFLKNHNQLAKLSPGTPGRAASRPSPEPGTEKSTDAPQDAAAKLEQTAAAKLTLAKELADAGRIERAKDRFEKIIAEFPNTKAAQEAKTLLNNLNK